MAGEAKDSYHRGRRCIDCVTNLHLGGGLRKLFDSHSTHLTFFSPTIQDLPNHTTNLLSSLWESETGELGGRLGSLPRYLAQPGLVGNVRAKVHNSKNRHYLSITHLEIATHLVSKENNRAQHSPENFY